MHTRIHEREVGVMGSVRVLKERGAPKTLEWVETIFAGSFQKQNSKGNALNLIDATVDSPQTRPHSHLQQFCHWEALSHTVWHLDGDPMTVHFKMMI